MVTSSFFGRVVMSRYLVEMANIPYTTSTRPSILDVISELFVSDKFHARPLISELPQVSAVDSRGRTIFVADAHHGGKRFVAHAEEKPTGFWNLIRLFEV